jgi:hypothetical protein
MYRHKEALGCRSAPPLGISRNVGSHTWDNVASNIHQTLLAGAHLHHGGSEAPERLPIGASLSKIPSRLSPDASSCASRGCYAGHIGDVRVWSRALLAVGQNNIS